jgi:SAM-dependent methyltransferase
MLNRLPSPRTRVHQWFDRLTHPAWRSALRSTAPLSSYFGSDRGTPVDRFSIETFLHEHRRDIRGHALEVKDRGYLDRFGSAVTHVDVLDIDANNPNATIVADLSAADAVASNQFDSIVLTQALQFIFDLDAAVGHLHRLLRPNGVLLATMPSITRMDRVLHDRDYWRFTTPSCQRLFGKRFAEDAVTVRSYGNMRTATAFLVGIAREELSARIVDIEDERFPVMIAVRAVKGLGDGSRRANEMSAQPCGGGRDF